MDLGLLRCGQPNMFRYFERFLTEDYIGFVIDLGSISLQEGPEII